MAKKTDEPKIKIGTTLPTELRDKLLVYAEREGLFVETIITGALNMWFDAMDGKTTVYKPTNTIHHQRLEAVLNHKDPVLVDAMGGVLGVCERLIERP